MERSDSPRTRQRRLIELQHQEQGDEGAVVLVAGGNHTVTTIYDLNDGYPMPCLALDTFDTTA